MSLLGLKPFYPLSLFKYGWGYGRNYFYTSKNNLYPESRINFLKIISILEI